MHTSARCELCVGADVSDVWEYFPTPHAMSVGADVSDAWECRPHSPYVYMTLNHYKCKGSMRVDVLDAWEYTLTTKQKYMCT
jgi:hypothetical protein